MRTRPVILPMGRTDRKLRRRFARASLLLVLVLANCFPISSLCSAAEPGAPPRANQRRQKKGGLDEQVRVLSAKLKLTAEQQIKVRQIFQRRQMLVVRIVHDTSMSAVDRFNAVRGVYDKSTMQVRSILDSDQAKKFDELAPKARMERGAQGRMGNTR